MDLRLNDGREKYRLFYGRNLAEMPKLVADARVPINTKQVIERRLEVFRNSDNELKETWMDNYFDTGDAILYHPDGRVKIVLDSQILRGMSLESKRIDGALILSEEIYSSSLGLELKPEQIKKMDNEKTLTAEQVKGHPIWKYLLREDEGLLEESIDILFSEMNRRFSYSEGMGVYLDHPSRLPKARTLSIRRLEGWSAAVARGFFNDGGGLGRLVGVNSQNH
ncbi:MAG: hypothetical protein AABW73_03635 [Nanoarchaeota archaeon]